jgi:copper ion binding protein
MDVSSTIEQTTLTALDISCGHCVATVTEALTALDGVQRVEASAETKQVAVSFDPGQVSVIQIESALDEAGYPVQK